jgi:SAM-dependent methyltransferase
MSTTARRLLDAYDPFALIYNRGMAEDFCRRAWPVVEQLLLARIPHCAQVLDLCCGSGQMARELSRREYCVTGIDASEHMIRIAKKNAPQTNFVIADARDFSLTARFDGVLCSFNSLAHAATVDELASILRNACAALTPNGLMLFDLSMEEAYASKWRGAFGEHHQDVAWIVRPSYDPSSRVAQNDCTVFRRTEECWGREDFTIHQRCFSEDEIRAAAMRTGFSKVVSYDAEHDLGMTNECGRRFFLCERDYRATVNRQAATENRQ